MNTRLRVLGQGVALALLLLASSGWSSAGKDNDNDSRKHYALIFGTTYGPDERPFYGVKVEVHPQGGKHPRWEIVSDHQGEFAVRVPPGPGDYVIEGQAEIVPVEDGKPQMHKKQRLRAEAKVHIDKEERQDISSHLK